MGRFRARKCDMKRDMDLIRELLLKLEAIEVSPGEINEEIPLEVVAVSGFTDKQLAHHLRMLADGGFIDTGTKEMPVSTWTFRFRKITWKGHDFLDSVRDQKIWEKTKKGAEATGGFTVDLLKDLARGFVKKQIEEHTGVKL
jgi:hypothetical protein